MKEPPFCMNRATENAKSSAGLWGTGPPNSVYLCKRYKEKSKSFLRILIRRDKLVTFLGYFLRDHFTQKKNREMSKKVVAHTGNMWRVWLTIQSRLLSTFWVYTSYLEWSFHSKNHCRCLSVAQTNIIRYVFRYKYFGNFVYRKLNSLK